MAYTDSNATVGGMITAGVGIVLRQAPLMAAFALINIVQQVIQHVQATARIGGPAGVGVVMLVSIIVALVVNLLLLREILSREGLMAVGTPLRLGTYIGVAFVVGLSTVAGLCLLIVPGILILLRWYLASFFVLARATDFDASLTASRDATKGHRGTIFGALWLVGFVYMVCIGALMLAAGGLRAYTGLVWYGSLGIVALLLQSLFSVSNVALSLGVFATLVDRGNQYEDVFG